jgi:hypothetical protein
MSDRELVNHKLKMINRQLEEYDHRLILREKTHNDEVYYEIIWEKPLDKDYVMHEPIFSGNLFDMFVTLNGIEYGMRLENIKLSNSIK